MASRVQAKGTATTAASLAFDSDVTADSLLVAVFRFSPGAGTFTGVSDNINGAWTLLDSVVFGSGSEELRMFYFLGAGAGATTVSRDGTGDATRFRFCIAEYDVEADCALATGTGAPNAQANASSTNCNSGAITAPSNVVLAIGCAATDEDSTFTEQTNWAAVVTGGSRSFLQEKFDVGAGSVESIPTINTAHLNGGGIALFTGTPEEPPETPSPPMSYYYRTLLST